MAARGIPEAILQHAVDEYARPRSLVDPYTKRRVWAGDFRLTDAVRDQKERILQQDVWKKSEENYWTSGWSRNEFDWKESFDEWVEEHIPYLDYQVAKHNILTFGQLAVLRVRDDDGFLRIDLEPVPGRWWHFKKKAVLDEWERTKYRFHISLTKARDSTEDPRLFERVKNRWNNRMVTIRISKVERSGNLILDPNQGIGADPDAQRLYRTGTFAKKFRDGYGMHISM